MQNIRNWVVSLGRTKKIILISIITLVTFVIISLVVTGSELSMTLTIAVALIISAAASWYITSLRIRIKHLEEHIKMLATHDALTGAMTRRAFMETYENTYYYTQRNKLPLALVSIELDNFKKINDTYGHVVNDEILISFSGIIEEQKRKSDIFTRMGWGKFVLVLPDTIVEDAMTFANKLQGLAREAKIKCHPNDIQYTVSMGVSGIEPSNQVNLEQLTKQADDALSQAQHQGTDCTIEFTHTASESA